MGKVRAESQERQAYQDQRITELESHGQAPAPASTSVSEESVARLRQLGELHEQGILTDEEFADQKQKVLAG